LGILNVVEAMELTPEVVYPLYLAASVDRYPGLVDFLSWCPVLWMDELMWNLIVA